MQSRIGTPYRDSEYRYVLIIIYGVEVGGNRSRTVHCHHDTMPPAPCRADETGEVHDRE